MNRTLNHIALWVRDLEAAKTFYCKYFNGCAGPEYVNAKRGFRSFFISFGFGARLELMHVPDVIDRPSSFSVGWAHVAFSVGNKEEVNVLTERLRNDGYKIISEPRTTGDNYYESVVLDPEGNHLEITV